MLKKIASGIMLILLLTSMFVLLFYIQPAQGATIIVPDDYPTIQQALDAANSSDTIYVRQGTYNENLNVPPLPYLKILGEDKDTTIVDGSFTLMGDYGSISGFTITGNVYGYARYSVTVADNTIYGGIDFSFESQAHLIADNTVYGGINLDGDYGSIIASNVIYGGISLNYGYHATPNAVNITGNRLIGGGTEGAAIYLCPESESINVVKNRIENAPIGIYEKQGVGTYPFPTPAYNSYIGNNISFCTIGIYFQNPSEYDAQIDPSSFSTVAENLLYDNTCGIYDKWVDQISIYHNSFVNNTDQIFVDFHPVYNTNNVWDDGYPSGGNYWSDYTIRYPSAIEIDDSRIWDTPYVIIDNSSQDNYPLMGPWTPKGEDITVTPTTYVSLTFESVISEGITTVNRTPSGPTPYPGYKIEGKYLDIETTASYSGTITIRLTYDDTSMTQQEEESLLLLRWNETKLEWEDTTTYVDMESDVIYGATNHLSDFSVQSELIHDLSIFGVHAFKTIIGQGYPLQIFVDVRNEGDFAEDFDVTVDLDSGQISYLSIFGVHLVNAETMTVTFTWNTAIYAKGTYSLTAHVSQVAYEIDTFDNTYPDGQVKVTIPGDTNGDWIVNIQDATQIGLWWQKTVPPAPVNVDINGNGIINIQDATIIGLNWQKHA